MAKKNENNWTAKTFFLVLPEKSIQNLGIAPDWTKPDDLALKLETVCRDFTPNFYGAVCRSADGFDHVHLAVSFEKAKRLLSVAKMFGNAHTEPMRGSKEQAVDYIDKNGAFQEKGEEVRAKFGKPGTVQDQSGTRLDIAKLQDCFRTGYLTASNLVKYCVENGLTVAQSREVEGQFSRYCEANQKPIRPVKVVYVEGATGTGKTYKALTENPDSFRVSVSQKTAFPFDGYRGQKVLILDELRPGVFPPAELFQILDHYPYTVSVKGSRFPAMWETVYITTTMRLLDWYSADGGENATIGTGRLDNNRAQLFRRIDEHYTATKTETEDGAIRYEWLRDERWAAVRSALEKPSKDGFIPAELAPLPPGLV